MTLLSSTGADYDMRVPRNEVEMLVKVLTTVEMLNLNAPTASTELLLVRRLRKEFGYLIGQ